MNNRPRLLELLRERAVLRGDFVLSSGERSTVYLDARLVTLSAAGSGLVGAIMWDVLRDLEPDAVAGLAIGADPIVTAIAVISGQSGRGIDALIVRKESKAHGAGRLIEGPWRDGMRVAVVEDTMTTGESALKAARAVQQEDGEVVCVAGLIDREQGAREAVEAAGFLFRRVYRAAEIVAG